MTFGKIPGPSEKGYNAEQKNRKGGPGLSDALRVLLTGAAMTGAVATTEIAEAQQPQGQEKSNRIIPGAKRVAPGLDGKPLSRQKVNVDDPDTFLDKPKIDDNVSINPKFSRWKNLYENQKPTRPFDGKF